MHKLNGHKPRVKAADVVSALDDGAKAERIMRKLYPLVIESAFLDASLAGIPVAFDLEMEEVQQVLDRLVLQVRGIAETTRDEVQRLVGRQASEGWSVEELARQIRQLAETRSPIRAITIARTETASAYSQGSLAAYQASGVVDRVEWLIGPDPCPDCEPLAGSVVALGAEFAQGIGYPPAHPSCTCAIAPILAEVTG
jgi:SPP1 gp7 family putative phage head morphogenesis protein